MRLGLGAGVSENRSFPEQDQKVDRRSVRAVQQTCPETGRVQESAAALVGHHGRHGATPAPVPVDLLAPAPLAGVLVGYGRVSTREQNLARQEAALTAAGCCRGTRWSAEVSTARSAVPSSALQAVPRQLRALLLRQGLGQERRPAGAGPDVRLRPAR
ncbi:recombinase family protein [Micromonospora radicis]|uniref:recombinase family protein n=1 Tax=Micromonospora radicis TaxID=1894971 RepID=UPI002277E7E4|nr:recombinase family protein [Micromonospora radicis]